MYLKWWSFKLKINHGFLHEIHGMAAIEFALISPVFFLIFMGIFEIGAIMVVQTSLETAILQVSRYGRTGSTVAGQTSQQTAVSLAGQYSFGLVDPNKLVLTITPYSSISSIPTISQAPNDGTQNFGTGKQYALYTLSYDWQFYTPYAGLLLSSTANSIKLTASTVVQNEPY